MATQIQANRERNAIEKSANELRNQLQKQELEEQRRANKVREALSKAETDLRKSQSTAQLAGSALSGIGQALGSAAGLALLNDIPWYVKSEAMAESIASLPDEDMVGTKYQVGSLSDITPSVANPNSTALVALPSVMTMDTMPTIGNAESLTDAVNSSADAFWSKINERNGRNSSYENPDLMMYQLGIGGHCMFIQLLMKLYSWISKYSEEDAALPRAVVESMGYDYDSLRRHKYDLHALIAEHSNFLKPYVLADDLFIVDRWCYEARTVLLDADETFAPKLYQYNPLYIPQLIVTDASPTRIVPLFLTGRDTGSPSTQSGGGNITSAVEGYITRKLERVTYEDLEEASMTLQRTFIGANDVKIMNSDIKSWYGPENNLVRKFVMPEDEPFKIEIAFTADKDALEQFHNADIFRPVTHSPYYDAIPSAQGTPTNYRMPGTIYQGTDRDGRSVMKSRILTTNAYSNRLGWRENKLLTFAVNWENIKPANIIETSRLACSFYAPGTQGAMTANTLLQLTHFAASIAVGLHIAILRSLGAGSVNGAILTQDSQLNSAEVLRIYDVTNAVIGTGYVAESTDANQSTTGQRFALREYYTSLMNNFKFAPVVFYPFVKKDGGMTEAHYFYLCDGYFNRVVQLPSDRITKMNKRIARRMLGLGEDS